VLNIFYIIYNAFKTAIHRIFKQITLIELIEKYLININQKFQSKFNFEFRSDFLFQ